MTTCVWTELCVFFKAEVGYSPELHQSMKERFCLTDNTGCARLEALDHLPPEEIPDDLIPTDKERLAMLLKALAEDDSRD